FRSLTAYCETYLGMTRDQALKRCQVVRLLWFSPKLFELFRDGQIQLAHLNLIAPRWTVRDSEKILAFVPGKSKRELKVFLDSLVDRHGRGTDAPGHRHQGH